MFPFSYYHYEMYSQKIVVSSWVFWLMISLIPHLLNYLPSISVSNSNNVCLIYYTNSANFPHIVLSSIVISINSIMHVINIVLASCTSWYIITKCGKIRSNANLGKKRKKAKVTLLGVYVAEIVSWLPLPVIGMLNLFDVKLSPDIWSVVSIVIVPLPPIINSVVYR